MKIGMVSEFYYPHPGGVSEHIRQISRALERQGHRIVVVTGGMAEGPMEPGPRVRRIGQSVPVPYNGGRSRITIGLGLRAAMRRVLREEACDLLHVHNPLMPVLPLLALEAASAPVVATLHSGYPRDRLAEIFRRPLQRRLDRAQLLLPVSHAARRAVEGIFDGSFRLVPNGVDVAFFAPNGIVRPPGPFRVLFAGAFVPRKGLPVLLRAFTRLLDGGVAAELWIAGDGPGAVAARRSVPARIRSSVRFLGHCGRDRLRMALAAADLFCAPSLERETFGLVLLEAMAAGVPIVASRIDGYDEVVTPGVDWWLVPPGDERALAEALASLATDATERRRLAARGRSKAAECSWDGIARELESIYLDLVEREGGGVRRIRPLPPPALIALPTLPPEFQTAPVGSVRTDHSPSPVRGDSSCRPSS